MIYDIIQCNRIWIRRIYKTSYFDNWADIRAISNQILKQINIQLKVLITKSSDNYPKENASISACVALFNEEF